MSGCGARTAAGSLEAVFESSDVERFGWILMEGLSDGETRKQRDFSRPEGFCQTTATASRHHDEALALAGATREGSVQPERQMWCGT